MEIEAKYAISDPVVFNTLLELRSLGEYALRPTGERHLIDHYLDTSKRDLLRGGYACRLREGAADRPWVLTVKGVGTAKGAVHEHEEYECEVPPGAAPTEWPESAARDMVTRLSGGRPLAEIVTLRQHRSDRAVEHDGRSVAVLSLDTVQTDIHGQRSVYREIEIELEPAGRAADLAVLDDSLRAFELKAEATSKFERALALLDDVPRAPKISKKKAVGLRADEPLAEAGRKILRFHFARMLASEKGTREGEDIEALHHMRVATRRQRAAFRIVSPCFKRKVAEEFRDALRTLADRLGAVRDLDVLIEAAERYRSSLRSPAALDPLLEEWRSRRHHARQALLHHLDRDEYRDFTERYGEFLSSPGAGVKDREADPAHPQLVRHVLPAEVWGQYGRVRAYETVMTWASIETIHALRIEAKRLRYLLEFFAEVLGPGLAAAIEPLVRLQDHIGELHDADVTIGLLRDFLIRQAQASPDPAVSDAVGRYLKITEGRLRTLLRTLKKPWKRVAGKRLRSVLARGVARL